MNRTSPPRSAQRVRSSAAIPALVADELHRYDDHLRDVRGLAAGTRRNHCRIVAQLLRKKFASGVVTMATLRPDDVRRFIARQLGDSPSHSASAQVATALQSYFRYRTVCGDSVARLSAVISSPVQWTVMVLGLHEAGKAGEEGVAGAQVETLTTALGQIVVDSGLQALASAHDSLPGQGNATSARFGVSSLA